MIYFIVGGKEIRGKCQGAKNVLVLWRLFASGTRFTAYNDRAKRRAKPVGIKQGYFLHCIVGRVSCCSKKKTCLFPIGAFLR